MSRTTPTQLTSVASFLALMAVFSACSSNRDSTPPGKTGGASGGVTAGGSSTGGGSGGKSSGGTGTGGAGTGGIGNGGADCPPEPDPDYVMWHSLGGQGGATAGASFICIPGVVCFGPDVPTSKSYPITFAFALTGSESDGSPQSTSPSGEASAVVTQPEPGRICIKGDDGASLGFNGGDPAFWDGVHEPITTENKGQRWDELGLKYVRFTIETPPKSGASVKIITFSPPCGEVADARAEQHGNPVVLSEDGTTTTLAFDTDFGPSFELSTAGVLNFFVGEGEYDYCVKDLVFLDENGDELSR